MNAISTAEFQVRGYTVSAATAYLKEIVGEQEARRMLDGMSAGTRKGIVDAASVSAGWLPAPVLSEVLQGIAAQGKGDEARTRDLLVNCGCFMAREATNTFLRLLMRMLTPTLFAKKLPDLWRRDCTHGTLFVDVGEQKFSCRAVDTDGFLHAPCTITGFITFTLQTMGKSIEKTTIGGWSLATPNPPEALIELVWKT